MIKTKIKELPAFQFHLLSKYSDRISHAVMTRNGGVSEGPFRSLNVRFGIGDSERCVVENRARVGRALGVERLVLANQTHSRNVKVIENESDFVETADREIDDVDGFVTNMKDIGVMIQVADCQAILMAVPSKGVVAAVHAGWRGLKQDISGEAIRIMEERFSVEPSEILVGISPSLGPCCSFFSNPREELGESFYPYIDEQNRVDLWGFSNAQLQSHGVKENHIEMARVCTQCENGRVSSEERSKGYFYSFRGDRGITGRFGVIIAALNSD